MRSRSQRRHHLNITQAVQRLQPPFLIAFLKAVWPSSLTYLASNILNFFPVRFQLLSDMNACKRVGACKDQDVRKIPRPPRIAFGPPFLSHVPTCSVSAITFRALSIVRFWCASLSLVSSNLCRCTIDTPPPPRASLSLVLTPLPCSLSIFLPRYHLTALDL